MKVLVVLSCALVLASAGYEGYYGKYVGPLAVPVIGPNGVPVETPEVQAAKANHLAAHAALRGYGPAYAAPVAAAYYGAPGAVAPDGRPLDTPEVAAAKAEHFAEFNKAAVRNGAVATPYYAASSYAPVAIAGPVDTPEVAHAKAAHFAAYAEAAARNSHGPHYRRKRSAYTGPIHLPVINEKGVPVDTPEVQAAKAYHFSALNEAATRAAISGPGEEGSYYDEGKKYYGPIHIPVIGPNGVPVDTPEVQHARAAHLAALSGHAGPYAAAPAAPYYGGHYASPYGYAAIGPDGQPIETPEVQAAKAAHFKAHATSRGYYY